MKVSIIGTLIAGIVATSLFNQAEANVGVTATTIRLKHSLITKHPTVLLLTLGSGTIL